MKLTEVQRNEIRRQRTEGIGYIRIANDLGISVNTVRSFCRRNGLVGHREKKLDTRGCLWCGKSVQQNPGRKVKKFCSDECRRKWWNAHPEKLSRTSARESICQHCGKTITAYASRKYCSHDCYIADRFGGDEHE